MAVAYDVAANVELAGAFRAAGLDRPMRVERYDAGTELEYTVTGVAPARPARVRLAIDKFVGGGFAGQVYRVKVLAIDADIPGLTVGGMYAMKILIPPSNFAVRFRNLVYWLGFQGPFSLQVNPDAARAGALWQKFIRRSARIEFGTERAVVDILATFVDDQLGSCGELSEWVEGRNWLFEVDDRLDARKEWRVGDPIEQPGLGSPEFRAKRAFMAQLVQHFHRLGAHELARQYEWSTCKSQPNCLKRLDSEGDPSAGLTAVDFRAGLALLPYLPMSPGDFKLIVGGVRRGSLVQFDRGDISKLEAYISAHAADFADMRDALDELKRADAAYRDSLIDVTHHHVRLLGCGRLWGGIFRSAVQSWRTRQMVDEPTAQRLDRSKLKTGLFALLGALPTLGMFAVLAAVLMAACGALTKHPFHAYGPLAGLLGLCGIAGVLVGRIGRTLWGRADYRRHYGHMLTSGEYFGRAVHLAERLISWNRQGRIASEQIKKVQQSPGLFVWHSLAARLPVGLHRAVTDPTYAWARVKFVVTRPIRLYFSPAEREKWLLGMLEDGRKHGMVSEEEAETIRRQMGEPFIQKYLKSLAVHLCTLPITHVVALAIAIYVWVKYQLPLEKGLATSAVILAFFQVIPISPGSLTRGLYVTYLVIRERNYRDYKIAFWLGFWKYIGYLSFPIQMAYRYPAIARFMASQWATGAVHIVPVFGEHGALMEHAVFDGFYNRPLTLRRRMGLWEKYREGRSTRYWPIPFIAAAGYGLLVLLPAMLLHHGAQEVRGWMFILAGAASGFVISRLADGAATGRRLLMGAAGGLISAGISVAVILAFTNGAADGKNFAMWTSLYAFISVLFGIVGGLVAELSLPEPPMPGEMAQVAVEFFGSCYTHPDYFSRGGPPGPTRDWRARRPANRMRTIRDAHSALVPPAVSPQGVCK